MNADSLSNTFAALADPTRRGMLARLSRGQANVSELVFDFAETSSELLGKTSDGHDFRAPVGADGSSAGHRLPVSEIRAAICSAASACIPGMTWAYCFKVKAADSWPSLSLITFTGTPACSPIVA